MKRDDPMVEFSVKQLFAACLTKKKNNTKTWNWTLNPNCGSEKDLKSAVLCVCVCVRRRLGTLLDTVDAVEGLMCV